MSLFLSVLNVIMGHHIDQYFLSESVKEVSDTNEEMSNLSKMADIILDFFFFLIYSQTCIQCHRWG